jgi:sulfatase maturation enzyme AslB (radical SAM superfamily)
MTPKDMLTNPYFCPMPWTGLMYNFDGKVKNCIRSVGTMPIGNIQNTPIEQILLGNENVDRQSSIINQTPVPSCQTCYDLERGKKGFDIISDRIFYIRELKQVPTSTYQAGNFDLQTTDVRWSNLCNFACVYCGPEFSSKWGDELKILPATPTDKQRENFKQYIYQHAHNLRHVYLAGGEPLLMKENLELLQKLNPNVQLRINTNLSKVDTRVFEEICKFKNVHWTVSVETIEQEFEYIRHGGNWPDFLDNLATISKLDHKITFNMLYFLLNYDSVFECVDYLKDLGFHNNSFVIGALLNPYYLNIRHLPENVLQSIKNKLQIRINESPGHLLEDSYRNMLHYIQQPFDKNLNDSFDKLAELDQRRNLDSSKIFKDLYKLREGNNHGKTI